MIRNATLPRARPGITLIEILISVMILGIGLVSLATLFPIGLLRLREAQRQTRSAYLSESATADVAARGLFNASSFLYADLINLQFNLTPWYASPVKGRYDPLIQDTAYYSVNANDDATNPGASSSTAGGCGLPFAYDPLWRYQTDYSKGGIYLFDTLNPDYPAGTPEFRFAAGNTIAGSTLRPDPSDGLLASAHGLQRLTNFNRPSIMAAASQVPAIFVSPEDIILQDPANPTNTNSAYTYGGVPLISGGVPISAPASSVVPDLNAGVGAPSNDWRFTWMITAQQNNSSNGAAFDGNIVIFENRLFGIDNGQVAGETVVEGVFGASTKLSNPPTLHPTAGKYGAGADRTVLLRWFATQPDPVVKVGDWIADVTYERSQNLVDTRFYFNTLPLSGPRLGVDNLLNNLSGSLGGGEWDNLPAQRCFWYQVQKVTAAQADPNGIPGGPYRSMTVYVNRTLDAKTLLDNSGNPVVLNAALICPNIVNVIPQTFFVR